LEKDQNGHEDVEITPVASMRRRKSKRVKNYNPSSLKATCLKKVRGVLC